MIHYALDEMFAHAAAAPLNLVGQMSGSRVSHVLDFAPAGTNDDDLPALCRDNDVHALVSINVKDFGAKKVIYQTLMAHGVHIAVLRPGKGRRLVPQLQVSLVAQHMPYMDKTFGPVAPPEPRLLVRLSESGAVTRSLDELVAEFDGSGPALP